MVHLPIYKALTFLFISLTIVLSLPAMAVQTDNQGSVVGELTAVIGDGKVINRQGERLAVRGYLIREGDQIETAAGGHVHVRFADGGLVSVRPSSRLTIEEYHNSNPENLAAIKFRLEVGVIRSVTGQWGEANRDRFRLNTPVAAIGIKGTDFIVKANSASTLVSVNAGAVVMAPLEGSCAVGLGPCGGDRSALLSADMIGKMLQYLKEGDLSAPRLIPYVDLLARSANTSQMASQRQVEPAPPGDTGNKGVDNQIITSQVRETVVAATAPAPAPVAPTPAAPAVPVSMPLVWLHNVLGLNVPANSISSRFDQASAAGRNAVIGNFSITLYRDETTSKDFTPPSTTASFNLLNASANFVQPSYTSRPVESVSISDAKLSVDFARNTLSTQMQLSSPTLGKDQFAATATITQQGLFVDSTSSQRLAGAFSTDARQAGYLFEKSYSGGKVSGLTLWGN